MTEEEKNENGEQAAEEAAAPAGEEPAAEAPAEEAPAPAEEAPAPAAAAPATAPEPEPGEQLSPKERRSRERSLHSGEARPARGPEERARERDEARRRKAARRRAYRGRERRLRAGEGPRQAPPEPVPSGTGKAKLRQGIVVSDKADKTITVRIDLARRHRVYKKIVRTSTTLHVHDEGNEAHVGDTVRVVESRPLSRLKRWRLVEVLERAR